jgi:hypothetical protein
LDTSPNLADGGGLACALDLLGHRSRCVAEAIADGDIRVVRLFLVDLRCQVTAAEDGAPLGVEVDDVAGRGGAKAVWRIADL